MTIRVGTSGYAYKEWKGPFYPADLPNDGMLAYYGERLATVEINNTFYRMPKEHVLEKWASQVPDEFRFVLKASRRLTHFQRLQDVEEPLSYLLNTATVLGRKLGPLLFQLPPNMKKDLDRLRSFLAGFPASRRAALEFRHASWQDEDVYDVLREHNVALCIADTNEEKGEIVATAEWGYLRLRRESYDRPTLTRWAKAVHAQRWSDTYVFFKHEDAGAGPKLASMFVEVLEGG